MNSSILHPPRTLALINLVYDVQYSCISVYERVCIIYLGGFVAMRHNNIRDFEAKLLKEVCRDVKVEPELLPIFFLIGGRNHII